MAAENGHYEIVLSLCLSGSSDLNQTSKRGVSALMLAAVKGHECIVKCLTEHNADINLENNDRTENALTMACQGGKAEIVEHLINLGKKKRIDGRGLRF
jgi:ankyrin repeat protein